MSRKILVVDDDKMVGKIIAPFFSSKGFEVTSVTDGEAAIELLKESLPSIVVLDVHMPKMNGYSFLFEMRKIPGAAAIPIIVLTSKDGMSEIFKFEGVKEYVNKPVDNEVLFALVSKYLQ